MKIENHLDNLKESIMEIEESISKGLVNKQRTLGFHASAGAADIIEIILHKNNLIDPGFIVKHEWFNSKRKIEEKLNFEFPRKKEILDLAVKIEFLRNSLCYGKRQGEEKLEELVSNFNKLKEIFLEVAGYEL